MENKTQNLLYEFSEIGRRIIPNDIDELVKSLIKRLNCKESDLDFSPKGLQTLEESVRNYHKDLGKDGFPEKELVKLIKEISAYVGQTMVVNLGAKWNENDFSFWSSSVVINKSTKTKKGKDIHSGPSRGWPAVQNVAYFWDMIDSKESEDFFRREYKAMNSDYWIEGLTKEK